MKLHTIHAGHFKLDGGAMFGVVPKSIWQKLNPPDDNNMCSWAMRCLLIEDEKRLILIDNGMGNKQDAKFFGHYYLHGTHSLEDSLQSLGFTAEDITDVFLTHLHFDHCGGGVMWNSDRSGYRLTFPNARYWSHSRHWEWAIQPNAREKASFLKENILPMQESGHLHFADQSTNIDLPFEIVEVFGHTEAMMLPLIRKDGKSLLYMADLVPSLGHIPLPYVMAYDMRPLQTLEEKARILQQCVDKQIALFFEHDPLHDMCYLETTEKGPRASHTFSLKDW